jgi:hypothetical protein
MCDRWLVLRAVADSALLFSFSCSLSRICSIALRSSWLAYLPFSIATELSLHTVSGDAHGTNDMALYDLAFWWPDMVHRSNEDLATRTILAGVTCVPVEAFGTSLAVTSVAIDAAVSCAAPRTSVLGKV